VRVADVECETHLGRRRIKLAEDGRDLQTFRLAGWEILGMRRRVDLWSTNAGREFDEAFGASGIGAALDRRLFNLPGPLVLRVPDGSPSDIPWEGFQRLLNPANRTKLAPVRIVDPDQAFSYATVPSAMSCLVLVGHPGPDSAFDPAAALQYIESTIRGAMTANGRIPSVQAHQLRHGGLEAVADAVRERKPNVVVYFGHGRNETGPELLLSPTEWAPIEEVAAELFPDAGSRPPFWIFWACSLADQGEQPMLRLGASGTLTALEASGAVAMLAMRSRIRVDTARPMLDALIGAFAAGEPLEVAAAFSRAAALAAGSDAGGRMDDAAPAVWTRSEPVGAITWGTGDAFPSTWVALPLLDADGVLPELASGSVAVDDSATALAASWVHPGRYFVTIPTGTDVGADPAVRTRLLGAASALRRMGGRPVVPVVMRTGATFDQRLSLWARDAHASLDPRHADREISSAIGAVARDGLAGLDRLLAIPDVVVLFSEPPDRAAGWDILQRAPADATVVVAGTSVPLAAGGWTQDLLMPDAPDENAFEDAMRNAPLACAILAIAERPLRLDEVAEMSGCRDQDLAGLGQTLVRIGDRRVLGRTARSRVTAELGPDFVADARRRWISRLAAGSLAVDFEALVEICRQYLELGRGEAAAEAMNAAWHVVGGRWSITQKRRLFGLAARSPAVRDGLEDGAVLDVAQAAVELQETNLAGLILDRVAPATTLDRMRRHALLAECRKADVGPGAPRTGILRHAEDAVACAEELAAGDPRYPALLSQRHNLARIRQYFEHDYDGALAVYQEIMRLLDPGLFTDAASAQLFAACARNGAECLLDPAARPLDGVVRDRIDELLRRGCDAAAGHDVLHAVADITYTRARTAEAAGDDAGAADLLRGLVEGPLEDEYALTTAIAACRLFWNDLRRGRAAFEWERLVRLLRRLDLFDHAWAVRTAIKARLRAVRVLMERGGAADLEHAAQLIAQNREQIGRYPGLGGQEDARSAARTEAAADVIQGDGGTAWAEFAAGPRARMLPADWASRTAAEIWEEMG
jgi:hypothetical protein